MNKGIPIHEFTVEDTKKVPVRYVQLNTLNDYDFSLPHRHNYFEVFFFTKGGGHHLIDFVKYPVKDNSLHIVYPGQVHVLSRAKASHGAVVHFAKDLYAAAAGALPIVRLLSSNAFIHIENTTVEQEELNTVLAQLKQEYQKPTPDAEVLKAYLHILLAKSVALLNGKNPQWLEQTAGLFSDFKEVLEEHFMQQKQAAFYAAKLKVSERKLNEACKKATAQTIGDYINNRILLEAKRLLCNSPLTAKEIAFHLGYNDPSYFNRFFKKNTGTTALDFRREAEKDALQLPAS